MIDMLTVTNKICVGAKTLINIKRINEQHGVILFSLALTH